MKRTPKVMLLIESSRAYERALLRGIARYSRLHGPWIFFREPPFWGDPPQQSLMAQLQAVDGIIMRECALLPEILKLRKPVIVSNVITEQIPGLPNIVSEHAKIGAMAADHLIDRGFRNFAFCGFGDLFWSRQRQDGFAQRVKEAGFDVHIYDSTHNVKSMPWEQEQRLAMKWLLSLPKPVGLMAYSDERGQQVAEVCKAAAIAVPDRVAIVGVDNDEIICNLSYIPLSSVGIDAEGGGYRAAALLERMMKRGGTGSGPLPEKIVVSPTHVIVRTSTDAVAIDDPQIAAAVKYIRDHCRRKIYVQEIARAVGLSRRVLEQRFRNTLARTISQQVRHFRIQMIMNLLLETTDPIAEIALAMGFPDAAHIARYFRSETHMSLAEYRRLHSAQ